MAIGSGPTTGMQARPDDEQDHRSNSAHEAQTIEGEDHHFYFNPFGKAIIVNDTDFPTNPYLLFLSRPIYAPLLFPNESSDARDHAANERTYLSYLRLAVYLAVVSVAIFINFHLKNAPTPLEERISRPLGAIFWLLALSCLAAGFANYVRTVAKYARKAALVQSGAKTQIIFGVVSCAIIAACGVFLAAEAQRTSSARGTAKAINAIESYVPTGTGGSGMIQGELLQLLGNVGGGTLDSDIGARVLAIQS